MAKQTTKPPVAIVGVSALFPGSSDLEGFWRDIVGGTDMIREIPPNYWLIDDYYDPDPTAPDKTYCKRGGFLDKLDFDPVAFGIPPSLLPTTDTAQLLALVMAKRVLEDVCQGDYEGMDRDKVSVILGVAAGLEPGDPAEIGAVIAFVGSKRNSYMTGANINVDGGSDFT